MGQSVADLIALGVRHHQARRVNEARDLYHRALTLDPHQIDALHLLGVLSLESGQPHEAVELIGQAIVEIQRLGRADDPAIFMIHANLGNALSAIARWEDAESHYRKALALQPNIAETHSNLGNVLDRSGRHEAAAISYRRAIDLKPELASAHFNLANVLARLGQAEAAIASFKRALDLQPEFTAASINLADSLKRQGLLADAIRILVDARSHRPNSAELLVKLADCLLADNQGEAALDTATEALVIDIESADAHAMLARVLEACGDSEAAVESFTTAVALEPNHVDWWFSLARLSQAAGRHSDAIDQYRTVTALDSTLKEAWFNLGNAYHKADSIAEAVAAYNQALSIDDGYAEAYAGLGTVLQKLDRLDEAVAALQVAVRLKPDFADAYYNLGNGLEDLGRQDEAIASFETAIELRPDFISAQFNLALALLRNGNYERGWRQYEYRWHPGRVQAIPRRLKAALWLGDSSVEGKRLLLHSEQGLGDTLQFCRYIPLVEALNPAQLIVEVQSPLCSLIADSFGSDRVVVVPTDPTWPAGDTLPPFDLHTPLLSLPLACRTGLGSIPAVFPYLRTDQSGVEVWRDRLNADPAIADGALKVGLVWAGDCRRHIPEAIEVDRRRSIALAEFEPLLTIPGIRLISLQKGEPAAQASEGPFAGGLVDPMGEVTSFKDTAELVANLDLVISVDTSVAHLVGALAKPIWMLSRFNGCWRWLMSGEASPWYPTMRVLRQPAPWAWQPLIAAIAADLATIVANKDQSAAMLSHYIKPNADEIYQ
jgi:tetratricopeptide (TPR) repeat protein